MNQPILFVSAGPYSWGSSRMRAYWPAQGLGANVIEFDALPGRGLPESGVIIWQKRADVDVIKRARHVRHVWDVCDPAWWWNPDEARQIADAVDMVVCSSAGLAADFTDWYSEGGRYAVPEELPVTVIQDRIDLDHFPQRRSHDPRSPIRLIWYGVAVNRVALFSALANLERLAANDWSIELTIFDDRPDQPWQITDAFPIYHVRWAVDRENAILAAHDIALLPPYPGPWGLVKSNNKALTAWASGLPVTLGDHYGLLRYLVGDAQMRQADADAGYRLVQELYTVDRSVDEWRAVLNDLAASWPRGGQP